MSYPNSTVKDRVLNSVAPQNVSHFGTSGRFFIQFFAAAAEKVSATICGLFLVTPRMSPGTRNFLFELPRRCHKNRTGNITLNERPRQSYSRAGTVRGNIHRTNLEGYRVERLDQSKVKSGFVQSLILFTRFGVMAVVWWHIGESCGAAS